MPTFSYSGIDATGQKITGVVEAYDEIEAMEQARDQVRIVQSIHPVHSRKGLASIEITKKKAKPKALSVMCSQFATILNAGLPADRAVRLVSEQCTDKYLAGVLKDVSSDVASGHGLADSFENKAPDLPRVFIETLRAGEQSGHLGECFVRLQKYFDRRAKVAHKISSALAYPIFVIVLAVLVVSLMMVLVIPKIVEMVESLGTDIPTITQFLIGCSDVVRQWWPLLLLVVVVLVFGLRAFGKTERGRNVYGNLALKAPIIGKITRSSGAGEFANTMATLIASGLSVTRAVRVSSRVVNNYIMRREIGRMEAGLDEGRSLGECMGKCEYFPKTLVEMVEVGESTGTLEETMVTMGIFYDEETNRLTDSALRKLEPTLLILMAIFAGFIVIALYLPMFSMYSAM